MAELTADREWTDSFVVTNLPVSACARRRRLRLPLSDRPAVPSLDTGSSSTTAITIINLTQPGAPDAFIIMNRISI